MKIENTLTIELKGKDADNFKSIIRFLDNKAQDIIGFNSEKLNNDQKELIEKLKTEIDK